MGCTMSSLDVSTPNRAERRRAASNRQYEIRPLRYGVTDVCTMLGCQRMFVYRLIKQGLLKAHGTKRKLWVTAASLESYLDSLPEYQPVQPAE